MAVGGQRFTAGLVHPVRGPRRLDAAADAVADDGVAHEGGRVEVLDLTRVEVPVRVERHRVDLAEVEVVEDQRVRVGGEQVEVGGLERPQRRPLHELLQRCEVVVLRAQAVVLDVLEHLDQRLQARAVPERLVAVARVDGRHRARGVERLALDGDRAAGVERLDALAQRLGHRVGGRRARDGGRRGLRRCGLRLRRGRCGARKRGRGRQGGDAEMVEAAVRAAAGDRVLHGGPSLRAIIQSSP